MGKKDKTIERILAQYAEEVKPDPSVIDDAKREADKMRREKDKRAAKKPFRFGRFVGVAACCLVVVVSFLLIYRFIPKTGGGTDYPPAVTEYYRETDLYMNTVTKEEAVKAAGDIRFMTADGILKEEYKLYSFKDGGKPAFVMGRLRIESERGVDDVSVIAEVTNKVIENFRKMSDLPETSLGRGKTNYDEETGEYITYAYLRDNSVKYYLYVMSPTGMNPDVYLDMLK